MRRCEVWGLVQCPRLAVEVLIFLNPLCAGKGFLAVCPQHLAAEIEAGTVGL